MRMSGEAAHPTPDPTLTLDTHRVFQGRAPEAVHRVGVRARVLHQPLHHAVAALRRRQVPARDAGLGFKRGLGLR